MNSTTATTATATATLPPLTTPFAVPASCTDSFDSTITYRDGAASSYTAFAAWPQTESGCQASGANVHRDGATIVARPGVCPSDWIAYNLKVDDPQYYPNADDTASVTFAAVCCSRCVFPSGHKLVLRLRLFILTLLQWFLRRR